MSSKLYQELKDRKGNIITYLYKCTKCNLIHEIEKPMKDSDKKEYCECCKTELTRVYKVGSIKTNDGIK